MQAALFLTPFGILSIFAENAAALFQAPLGILSQTLKMLSALFQTPVGIISYPCCLVGTIAPSREREGEGKSIKNPRLI